MDGPRHWRFGCSKPARYFPCVIVPLHKALRPARRSSHIGPVIKIATIRLKFTWICSGSWFEILKAYGILKLMDVIDQHNTLALDGAASVSPTQPHGTSTRHSSPNRILTS